MSEDIQRLRTEYESLVSQHQDTSSTLAPWIVREEVRVLQAKKIRIK